VNVFFDNGSLYANTTGMLFCLDPATGHVKWKNALPGCGYGIAALASVRSSSGNLAATRQMQLNKEAAADASVAS
jgi:outer membrane protein assembly factor BamB